MKKIIKCTVIHQPVYKYKFIDRISRALVKYVHLQWTPFLFRSDIETHQYQMTFEIPRINVKAQYRSSGVLILVRASGAGDYWGEYRKWSVYYYVLLHGLKPFLFLDSTSYHRGRASESLL